MQELAALFLVTVVLGYALAYPVVWFVRLVRGKPASRSWTPGLLWALSVLLIFGVLLASGYFSVGARAMLDKTRADTRAIAAAIEVYVRHCGGLPPAGEADTTNCAVAGEPQSGPAPFVLLKPQTNARGQTLGPILGEMPSLVGGWTGSGFEHRSGALIWRSYKYVTRRDGWFLVCATGGGTGANSRGGTECP